MIVPTEDVPEFRSHFVVDEDILQKILIPPSKLKADPNIEDGDDSIIGTAAYGIVLAKIYDGKSVAVKKLHTAIHSSDTITEFKRELIVMRDMQHPNVVQVIGGHFDTTSAARTFIVMERLECSLRTFLELVASGRYVPTGSDAATVPGLTLKEVALLGLDVCCAMVFLQARGVLHRDLHSGNFLLARDFTLKTGDFGLSKAIGCGGYLSTPGGAAVAAAPEVFLGRYSFPADVYSVGLLLAEMAMAGVDSTDPSPLHFSDEAAAAQELMEQFAQRGLNASDLLRRRMRMLTGCLARFPELDAIVRPALALDPHARPSFAVMLAQLGALLQSSACRGCATPNRDAFLVEALGLSMATLTLPPPPPPLSSPTPSANSDLQRARELLRAHRYADSLPHFEAALRAEPSNSAAHAAWGLALMMLDRRGDAAMRFEVATLLDPRNATAHCHWALCLHRLYQRDKAREHASTAARLDPRCTFACGTEHFVLEQYVQAVTHYEAAARADPQDLLAVLYHGRALSHAGQPEAAITQFQAALRLNANCSLAHACWGRALNLLRDHESAIGHCREALRLSATNDLAFFQCGYAFFQLGHPGEAIRCYRGALRYNAHNFDAHHNLGVALNQESQYESALPHFIEALRLNPTYALVHYNWGSALLGLQRYEEALTHYRETIRLAPGVPDYHHTLANTLYNHGAHAESLAHYESAVELNGKEPIYRTNMANALLTVGRVSDAISHFREALELDPRDVRAHDGLARAQKQRR